VILADTSVWVEHFRRGDPELRELLREGMVVMHPFVLGELACGNLRRRKEILGYLGELPAAVTATDEEVLRFVEGRRLYGRGVGWVDVHLLASARLSGVSLRTRDRRLAELAGKEGVAGG
jgi:predicted nucleic acid-binding protein